MDYGFVSSPSQSPLQSQFPSAQYFESTSESSGPSSPHVMSQMMYNSMPMQFEMLQHGSNSGWYCTPEPDRILAEYADSSSTDGSNRQRRRTGSSSASSSKDKDTIPNMHLRRRAQNRASQRAFRERKEKHVKGLERQLEDLHEKHQDLLHSYTRQADEMTRLNTRIQGLNGELESLRACTDQSFSELLMPDKFEKFDAFSRLEMFPDGPGYNYFDKAAIDFNQASLALDSLDASL